jgi:hypothetical protein
MSTRARTMTRRFMMSSSFDVAGGVAGFLRSYDREGLAIIGELPRASSRPPSI